MTNADAAGGAREPAVGDQGYGFPQSLAIDEGGDTEHFTHPGSAAGTFIANDDHHSGLDLPRLDRRHASLFVVEYFRGTPKSQGFQPGDFQERTLRAEIALEDHQAPGRRQRRMA